MISIVIPCYNSSKTIAKLLDSIESSEFKDYETIVVDDCSIDDTLDLVRQYGWVKLVKLEKNSGPAKARNIGVEYANGDIVLFFDSDVIIHKDVLQKIDQFFNKNKNAISLIGIYSKNPVNKGFTPRFKALLDYHSFTRKNLEKVTSFEPRCGAVKKQVFKDVGGFATKFKGADVEDYELGYRLLEKGPIYIDTSIQIDHHFPCFKNLLKNFLKRGYQWFNLFLSRKKFDNVGTTSEAAFPRGLFFLSSILIILSIFYFKLLYLAFLFFILGIFGNLKLYKFILKETNFLFLLRSVIVDYILSVLLGISAVAAILTYQFKNVK